MSLPRMSWHIGDYQKDTGHLRAAEHGAYFLLCMHYWATGGLPDCDRQLATIARMSDEEWARTRPLIEPLFKLGKWKHKRIEEELVVAYEKYEARAEAGRKGNEKRWHGRRAEAEPSHCDSNAIANGSQPITNNPIPIKEEKKEKSARGTRLPENWQPSDKNLLDARQLGLSEAEINFEADKFRDYWVPMPGQRGVKLDWDGTWRNWCRNRRPGNFKGKSNVVESDRERRKRESREALDKLTAFGEGRTNGNPGAPVVRFLPRTGTSSEPGDISDGSGGTVLSISRGNRAESG